VSSSRLDYLYRHKFEIVGMPAETTAAICCMLFGGVLEKFPRLRVCFAHGGESACQIENLLKPINLTILREVVRNFLDLTIFL
jgi:predicted TIM-barrel fold metal-dependent hydrolase